eukprot:gene2137-3035_t
MQTIPTPELILSLIKNDLINTRLVTGLDRLGLDAGDYLLGLGSLVLRLMGFTEGHLTDAVYDRYYNLTRRAACADLTDNRALYELLAKEIYKELQTLLPKSA